MYTQGKVKDGAVFGIDFRGAKEQGRVSSAVETFFGVDFSDDKAAKKMGGVSHVGKIGETRPCGARWKVSRVLTVNWDDEPE